jgi:hypothetical protein
MLGAMASQTTTVPERAGYGAGCYRRAIRLEAGEGEVRGELADDFHHFAVTLRHDGSKVTDVAGEGIRVPWTTCTGAVPVLSRLAGADLASPLTDILRYTPARAQCTHLHDLACLAVTQAARAVAGVGAARRYDVAVPDRVRGETRAELRLDGWAFLGWHVEEDRIAAANPREWEGVKLTGRAFQERLVAEADPDVAEAAFVLRRALFIATGRRHDFEAMTRASEFASVVGAACHTFDPARADEGRKIPGTVRDFTDGLQGIFDRPGDTDA